MTWSRLLLAAWLLVPWSAGAQPPGAVPRIGLLDTGSLEGRAPLWEAFRQAMRELGYVEGRTVVFEARRADEYERLAALAADLVRLKVDVIVTAGTSTARVARQATTTIPIVTATGAPLAAGLVASRARPGGNMTGLSSLSSELSAKRFELARELVPGASRFMILWIDTGVRANITADLFIREARASARSFGVRLDDVSVRGPRDLDRALSR